MTSRRKRRADKHPWAGQPISRRAPVPGARKRRPIAALTPTLLLPAALVAGSAPFVPTEPDPQPPRELGATGKLPQQPAPSPELLHRADRPDELRGRAAADQEIPEDLGIPQPVLVGYRDAADELQRTRPQCRMPWSLLASIGRIESGHASGGAVDAEGTTLEAILGPRLSGGEGVAAVRDTDGGRHDGDPVWDRAVGPMQFIPATWEKYATDGNDDGTADPHNVHDASAAAGEYLCAGGRDVSDPEQAAEAVFSYNRSDEYVRTVLVWADAYERGVLPTRVDPPPASRGDVLAGQRLPADDSPLVIPDLPPVDARPVGEAPAAGPTGIVPPEPGAPEPGAPEPGAPEPGAQEPGGPEPVEPFPPQGPQPQDPDVGAVPHPATPPMPEPPTTGPPTTAPATEPPADERPIAELSADDAGTASPSPPEPPQIDPPTVPDVPGTTERPPDPATTTASPGGSPTAGSSAPAPTSRPQVTGEPPRPSTAPEPTTSDPAPLTGIDPVPAASAPLELPTAGPDVVDPGALRPCEVDVLRTGEFAPLAGAERGPADALRPGEVVRTGPPEFRQPCRVPESYRS